MSRSYHLPRAGDGPAPCGCDRVHIGARPGPTRAVARDHGLPRAQPAGRPVTLKSNDAGASA